MRRLLAFSCVMASLMLSGAQLAACPFCPSQSQSLSEEMDTMNVTVVVRLKAVAPADAPPEHQGTAEFEVETVLSGHGARVGETLRTVYFGDGKVESPFLMFGVDPPKTSWTTPMSLTARSLAYLQEVVKLPKTPARLIYFLKRLEDQEPLIAQDAYDEFARAPYADVKALKSRMDREQLLTWIREPKTPANRRRLYLTMLGVCGGAEDLPLLEKMLRSSEPRLKASLDAMIACYVTLKGADALPLVEQLFLRDVNAEYSDTYAAIMALRFHGTEGGVVKKEQVAKSLYCMLERPALADLVIPDLARWEDWSKIDRLVELFKTADEKSSWVKVPVVHYLHACPLPEAKAHLAALKKLDPTTVERAKMFFPDRRRGVQGGEKKAPGGGAEDDEA